MRCMEVIGGPQRPTGYCVALESGFQDLNPRETLSRTLAGGDSVFTVPEARLGETRSPGGM